MNTDEEKFRQALPDMIFTQNLKSRSRAYTAVVRAGFHLPLYIAICVFIALLVMSPSFAKDKADLLVVHGTVVTMDAQRRIIDDGAVAIRGDSIAAVGKSAEIESHYDTPKIMHAH